MQLKKGKKIKRKKDKQTNKQNLCFQTSGILLLQELLVCLVLVVTRDWKTCKHLKADDELDEWAEQWQARPGTAVLEKQAGFSQEGRQHVRPGGAANAAGPATASVSKALLGHWTCRMQTQTGVLAEKIGNSQMAAPGC